MENRAGDRLSDLCAGLLGGLGCAAGSNIGDDASVVEALHGSAPDIAGKGVANPLAFIMTSEMMIHHIGDHAIAEKIRKAYDAVLSEGRSLTRDLGGTATTEQFADAVIAKL